MVYSEHIRDIVFNALQQSKPELKNVKYPNRYTVINLADIHIILNVSQSGIRETLLRTQPGREKRVDSQYIQLWKQYAPGKFIPKDYRKDIHEEDGNTPYWEFSFKYGDKYYRVLIRKLIESYLEPTKKLNEHDLAVLIHDYTDFTYNDIPYSIIKIKEIEEDDDTWFSDPGRWKVDILHDMFIDVVPSLEQYKPNVETLYNDDIFEEDDSQQDMSETESEVGSEDDFEEGEKLS